MQWLREQPARPRQSAQLGAGCWPGAIGEPPMMGHSGDVGMRRTTRKSRKSEWVPMVCREKAHKDIIRTWFAPLCDDMTPESADVLEDVETGMTKKARARMVDNKTGCHFTAIRRHTKAGW